MRTLERYLTYIRKHGYRKPGNVRHLTMRAIINIDGSIIYQKRRPWGLERISIVTLSVKKSRRGEYRLKTEQILIDRLMELKGMECVDELIDFLQEDNMFGVNLIKKVAKEYYRIVNRNKDNNSRLNINGQIVK